MAELKLPKVSELLKPLADLEAQIRTQIESTTGLPAPLGPTEIVKNVLETVETSAEGLVEGLMKGSPLPLPGVEKTETGGKEESKLPFKLGTEKKEETVGRKKEGLRFEM